MVGCVLRRGAQVRVFIGKRMLMALNDYTDDGVSNCKAKLNELSFDWNRSNQNATNFERQILFITEALKDRSISKTVESLNMVRLNLLNDTAIILVGNNASDRQFDPSDWVSPTGNIQVSMEHENRTPALQSVLKPVKSIDSCFIMMNTPAPTEYNAARYAQTQLATTYLTMQEGPMWNAIRGPGLAYSYSLHSSLTTGYTTLMLYRVTREDDALAQAERIVTHIPKSISTDAINEAKMNIIVSLVDAVQTDHNPIVQALQGTPKGWDTVILQKVHDCTTKEMR